jgi:hypothetical protein
MNQPTTQVLESTPESISSGTLDPSRPPALTIDSGDIVSCPNTWTQWGNQARFGMSFADREPLRRQFPSGPYSNLGPVEVRGAEPSQVGCSGVTGRARRRVAGSSRRRGRDHLLGWGGGDARVRAVGVGSGGKVRDLLGLDGRLGGFGEEERHRFGGEVAALHEAFVVLFQEQRAGGADHGLVVGEDPDDVGAAADLLVHALERVRGADLGPVLAWERVERGQVLLRGLEQLADGTNEAR